MTVGEYLTKTKERDEDAARAVARVRAKMTAKAKRLGAKFNPSEMESDAVLLAAAVVAMAAERQALLAAIAAPRPGIAMPDGRTHFVKC